MKTVKLIFFFTFFISTTTLATEFFNFEETLKHSHQVLGDRAKWEPFYYNDLPKIRETDEGAFLLLRQTFAIPFMNLLGERKDLEALFKDIFSQKMGNQVRFFDRQRFIFDSMKKIWDQSAFKQSDPDRALIEIFLADFAQPQVQDFFFISDSTSLQDVSFAVLMGRNEASIFNAIDQWINDPTSSLFRLEEAWGYIDFLKDYYGIQCAPLLTVRLGAKISMNLDAYFSKIRAIWSTVRDFEDPETVPYKYEILMKYASDPDMSFYDLAQIADGLFYLGEGYEKQAREFGEKVWQHEGASISDLIDASQRWGGEAWEKTLGDNRLSFYELSNMITFFENSSKDFKNEIIRGVEKVFHHPEAWFDQRFTSAKKLTDFWGFEEKTYKMWESLLVSANIHCFSLQKLALKLESLGQEYHPLAIQAWLKLSQHEMVCVYELLDVARHLDLLSKKDSAVVWVRIFNQEDASYFLKKEALESLKQNEGFSQEEYTKLEKAFVEQYRQYGAKLLLPDIYVKPFDWSSIQLSNIQLQLSKFELSALDLKLLYIPHNSKLGALNPFPYTELAQNFVQFLKKEL